MSWMIIKDLDQCVFKEKTNTKKNLVRVTTKSKSRMQAVSNGYVSQTGNESSCWRASQHWRPCQMSKIEALEVLRAMFKRDKTYDNQTEEVQQNWRTVKNWFFWLTSEWIGWNRKVGFVGRVQQRRHLKGAVVQRERCHDSFHLLSPNPLISTLVASDVTSPTPLGLTNPTGSYHDQSNP